MKIGIIALESGRRVGGLEVYETNLIGALAEVDHDNEYHIFCLDAQIPRMLGVSAPNFQFHVLSGNRFKGILWDIPTAMAKAGVDIFHALFVPPPFTSIPYVFTHHGTEVLERPDFYPWALGLRMRVLFRRAIAKAGAIICVSDYVREYHRGKSGIRGDRLHTVYCGLSSDFRPLDVTLAKPAVERKHGLGVPYILAMGRIEPRKNPIRLLEAYNQFRRMVKDPPKLVYVGMKTWSGREWDRTIRTLGLESLVIELGHLPHEDLPALYAGAEFAIYPSLWEGFGLPVLEAMATGTPMITSCTTSLPEVSGDACMLVDPLSIDALSSAMRELHQDGPLRERLAQKGLERARSFSWHRAALETLSVYRSLAESRAR